jgi:glutaredoxin
MTDRSAHRSLHRLAAGVALLAAALLLAPAPALIAAPRAAGPAAADSGAAAAPQVTLYATSWCPWCRKTRALLAELKVAYQEKDVEKTPGAAAERDRKAGAGAGVPVLDIGGTIVLGYDPPRIRAAVGALAAKNGD